MTEPAAEIPQSVALKEASEGDSLAEVMSRARREPGLLQQRQRGLKSPEPLKRRTKSR